MISVTVGILFTSCTSEKSKGADKMNDNENKGKNMVEQEEKKLATKEFLIETYHLTEEEIEESEIEKLITYFELTEGFFLEEISYGNDFSTTIYNLLIAQEELEMKGEEENNDFSYLLEAEEFKGEFPELGKIRHLAASMNIADGGYSCFIDFKNFKIYYEYNTAFVYENIQNAEEVLEISETVREEIINALKEAEIDQWDYSYVDKNEPSGEVFWDFGMEFEDGTIISFSGKGGSAASFPELRDVIFGFGKREK